MSAARERFNSFLWIELSMKKSDCSGLHEYGIYLVLKLGVGWVDAIFRITNSRPDIWVELSIFH